MKLHNLSIPAAILTLGVGFSTWVAAAPVKKGKVPTKYHHAPETQAEALSRYRSLVTGIGSNALRAPFGRFLLVKSGSQCLALRITEHIDPYTSKYDLFLQTDGTQDFSKANVRKRSGQLSAFKNGSGSAYIRIGSFPVLEWSPSDWIYFTVGGTSVGGNPKGSQEEMREKNIRMAITEWVRIEDVKPKSSSLTWLSKAQAKKLSQ